MTILLDGRKMTSREATHSYIAAQLSFPAYYGHNLDALYDLLTERSEKTELLIENSDAMLAALGSYGEALLDTLRDAAENNPRLTIELQ